MANVAVLVGSLLTILGLYSYFGRDTHSVTALIPAFLGLPLFLLGTLSYKDAFRKHAMHTAVLIALLGFLGCAVMAVPKIPTLVSEGKVLRADGKDATYALVVQLVTGVLCLAFVGLGVNSFIQARRRRQAGAKDEPV